MQGGVETMQQTSVQKQKNKFIDLKEEFYMFKKMKHMKNEKGLTLIELLAVIVILAIIAAIAIPAIGNIINNTRDKAVLSDVQAALSAAKIAKADGSCVAEANKCNGSEFEFVSDKIANRATGGGEDVTITFGADGSASSIVVKLTGEMKGTKISSAINGTTGNSITGKDLTISESHLNKVLGGN